MKAPLFYSFFIGFLAASPLGPIGLLCMRRVLIQGFISGVISALGISCAYAFWAYVAIHGLANFSYWIEREQQPLEIAIGFVFFLYGLNAVFNHPETEYPTFAVTRNLICFPMPTITGKYQQNIYVRIFHSAPWQIQNGGYHNPGMY